MAKFIIDFSLDSINKKLYECGVQAHVDKEIGSKEELVCVLKKDMKILDKVFYGVIFNEIKNIIVKEFGVMPEQVNKSTVIEKIFPLDTRIEQMKILKGETELELPLLFAKTSITVFLIVLYLITVYFWFSFLYNTQIIIFVMPVGFLVIFSLIIGLIPIMVFGFFFPKWHVENRFDRISTFDDFVEDVKIFNKNKSEELVYKYLTTTASPSM